MTAIRWYAFGFTLFWLAVLLAFGLYVGGADVVAQVEQPVATVEPNACVILGHAGAVPVFRCTDEDMYIVCYSQSPMLYCLPKP